LTIVLVVAAIGYVLWSRMQGRPLKVRRLLLPAVLTVLGILDLTGSPAPHLTPKDITFLVVSVALSLVLGGARGATLELYPRDGELWQRYRPVTVVLWVALIAVKIVLLVIASAAGATAGGGATSLLGRSGCLPRPVLRVPEPGGSQTRRLVSGRAMVLGYGEFVC
jgi:hypothetical protein